VQLQYSDVAATVVSAGNRENLLDSGAGRSIHRRKVIAGRAEDAQAWTDGQLFVAIDQRHLRKMYNTTFGMRHLINSLVHECCHTEPCYFGSDPHDETFTQLVATVHEDYGHELEKPVWKMVGRFLQTCEHVKGNNRLPKYFATTLDRIEAYQQQAQRFEGDEDVEAIDQFVEDLNAPGLDAGCGHDHGPHHDDGASTEAAADEPSQENSAAEGDTAPMRARMGSLNVNPRPSTTRSPRRIRLICSRLRPCDCVVRGRPGAAYLGVGYQRDHAPWKLNTSGSQGNR